MVQLKEDSVAAFYAEKSIFITGGTGFLGKVLIEKLLYSCKAVDQIYVLIRKKKDQTPSERIAQLLESELFSRLRKDDPSALKKVVPVVGDLTMPNLGLSAAVQDLIVTKVSIIFHVAATVKFNERMKNALANNVEATREVINLCHRLEKVDAFIHVSTAYSNTDQKVVEERVYPPPAPLSEVYAFVTNNGDDMDIIQNLLNGRPNTYTYTKALAEDIVLKEHGGIPTAIIRPSIVLSVLKEPIPGWLDNWNGPTGLLHASSQGVHCSMLGSGSNVADLIPVDIVTNLMIVVASRCKKSNGLKVYNSCSGTTNPIAYQAFTKMFLDSCISRGWNKVPFPMLLFVKWAFLNRVLKFFLVIVPFFLIDVYLRFFGKPNYMRMITYTKKAEDLMTFFTSHEWQFKDGNVRDLINMMSPEDRKIFYCDPDEIHWKPYFDDYCVGVFKYLLKRKV
uniref:Fatty acyl-CoA reductase n=1 Tax=Yponomeuta evonymella TaxID=2567737 RepID=D7P5E3_YPOEV|nr:fatty-acyl CoA reductase II [Yponomeuta evonymella]